MEPDTTLPKAKKIKVYTAILSQTGTEAPTVIVLHNTLGEAPVWSRVSAGRYRATTVGDVFTTDKTIGGSITGSSEFIYGNYASITQFDIHTANAGGTPIDDALSETAIEIRVYL